DLVVVRRLAEDLAAEGERAAARGAQEEAQRPQRVRVVAAREVAGDAGAVRGRGDRAEERPQRGARAVGAGRRARGLGHVRLELAADAGEGLGGGEDLALLEEVLDGFGERGE